MIQRLKLDQLKYMPKNESIMKFLATFGGFKSVSLISSFPTMPRRVRRPAMPVPFQMKRAWYLQSCRYIGRELNFFISLTEVTERVTSL